MARIAKRFGHGDAAVSGIDEVCQATDTVAPGSSLPAFRGKPTHLEAARAEGLPYIVNKKHLFGTASQNGIKRFCAGTAGARLNTASEHRSTACGTKDRPAAFADYMRKDLTIRETAKRMEFSPKSRPSVVASILGDAVNHQLKTSFWRD